MGVVVVAALAFVWLRGGGSTPTATPAAGTSAAATSSGSGASTTTEPPVPGFTPYTIDIPRIAEVAYRDLIYSVASGNVVARETANELRLRIRAINNSGIPANFWDQSFRLTIDGRDVTPTSGLNEILDGHSLRYGIVAFPVPRRSGRAVLHILDGQQSSDVPLDVSPTGRPAVDEKAEIADSQGQAILRGVIADAQPLIESREVPVTLLRVSTRRFANTLRVNVSFRMANRTAIPREIGRAHV